MKVLTSNHLPDQWSQVEPSPGSAPGNTVPAPLAAPDVASRVTETLDTCEALISTYQSEAATALKRSLPKNQGKSDA